MTSTPGRSSDLLVTTLSRRPQYWSLERTGCQLPWWRTAASQSEVKMKSILLFLQLALLQLAWAGDLQEVAAAGIDDHAKAAYFVLASSGYVFALNVVPETGDVWFHMNAPASHSWMGVGFGSSMENTRMIISYISEDGHNLVNSPRMSRGQAEPEWEKDIVIENVKNDQYAPYSNTLSPDGIMISHAVCRNCSSWATGSINTTSTTQPFIFALGPNITLHNSDKDAPLRLHEFHGSFQLDMTVATNSSGSYGRVPAPQDPGLQVGDSYWAFANYYSSNAYSTGHDAEWAQIVHAVFMCLAFLLVFPIGAISLRLVRRAPIHAAVQTFGLGLVLIGFGLGVYASKLYNKVSYLLRPRHHSPVLTLLPVQELQLHPPNHRPSSPRSHLLPDRPWSKSSSHFHAFRHTHSPREDPPLSRNLNLGSGSRQWRHRSRLRRQFSCGLWHRCRCDDHPAWRHRVCDILL